MNGHRYAARHTGAFAVRRVAVVATLMAVTSSAGAVTDCARQVKAIFNDFSGMVYVTFVDGGAPVTKDLSVTSSTSISRFLSVSLAAQTTGRSMKIRYPENGAVCPPAAGSPRNDFTGYWLMDQ